MEPCLTPALLGRIASDLQGLRRLNAFEVAGDHTISLLDLLEVGLFNTGVAAMMAEDCTSVVDAAVAMVSGAFPAASLRAALA